MKTFIFGQTEEMAQKYFDTEGRRKFLNIQTRAPQTVEVLTDVIQLPTTKDSLVPAFRGEITVYLVGDWELNPKWPDMLQRFRCLANVCVVKMFVARDMI